MGVSWESVLSQFLDSQSRELRSCWVQTPKQTPNRLPIGCPEGTFPYFRVAISAVKSVKCVSSRLLITQRSEVQILPPQPFTVFGSARSEPAGLRPRKTPPLRGVLLCVSVLYAASPRASRFPRPRCFTSSSGSVSSAPTHQNGITAPAGSAPARMLPSLPSDPVHSPGNRTCPAEAGSDRP